MSPYDIALHLWCLYFATTEDFDRKLPGCWSDWSPDEWMPRHDYRASSTVFARDMDRRVKGWLSQLEISREDSDAARNRALKFSHRTNVELASFVKITESLSAPLAVEIAGRPIPPSGRAAL